MAVRLDRSPTGGSSISTLGHGAAILSAAGRRLFKTDEAHRAFSIGMNDAKEAARRIGIDVLLRRVHDDAKMCFPRPVRYIGHLPFFTDQHVEDFGRICPLPENLDQHSASPLLCHGGEVSRLSVRLNHPNPYPFGGSGPTPAGCE